MENEKHSEKTLRQLLENQHLFRAVFDNTLDAILLADDEARYIEANPAACALTGYEHQELLCLSVWDLTPEQDVDAGQQSWQAFLNSGSLSGEYALRRKDETLIEVEFRAVANILPGVHLSAMRDITERKQAEEALHQSQQELADFIENAAMPMHWVGPDGAILWANQAELDLLGYKREEYIGRHIAEFHSDKEVIEDILQRLANRETLYDYEARLCCKDGSIKYVRINSNVLWEDGKFIHSRCFTRDITERKQAQEELERAHSRLEQEVEQRTAELSQAVSMLKSEIAERKQVEKELRWSQKRLRELNRKIVLTQEEERRRLSRELHDSAGQMLTALQLNLSLLRRSLAADDGEVGQGIAQALQMAETAYEEIRAVSHALRPPALDIAGLSQTLAGFCHDFARHTGLDIDYQGVELPSLPDSVAISYYRFLQEGLTNVAKHAQAEKVQVKLNYEDDTLYLSIEDDGIGFTLATEVERPEGVGLLGLQERLELVGGQLEIDSQPGRGTRLVAHYRRE